MRINTTGTMELTLTILGQYGRADRPNVRRPPWLSNPQTKGSGVLFV